MTYKPLFIRDWPEFFIKWDKGQSIITTARIGMARAECARRGTPLEVRLATQEEVDDHENQNTS